MNRLFLRPIARAIWAQRPPAHHHCVNVSRVASPCRQFASSSSLRTSITPSEQQLSSLLASGMQQDDLAKEIASLFSRTKENWLILQLEDQLIKHTNRTGERQLFRKFNEYLHQIEAEAKAQKTAADAAESSSWFSAEARAALARKGVHHKAQNIVKTLNIEQA
ncbi:hypothetical protein K443DRAFT_278510 [Laccaria amethystina LaAM-08-1]|uniref:Uncharacterized protein n=1 Tax=Laccaria amethystina LaAM-08-1 TaxID=1095629 RepID=A0A0C9Y869_9AGAR|nr:hypothetical protein K443DRAFT_278510 [Laccaria amethystina LaAM-08-1]